MKLRNKRTGKIVEWENPISYKLGKEYDSLAEFCEEWEDAPEGPKDKGYWYIDDLRCIHYSSELLDEIDDRPNNWMIRKLWGNYFNTREEAKKAVNKLKAWKRLKDKGFRFTEWSVGLNDELTIKAKYSGKDILEDMNLLFGGEE